MAIAQIAVSTWDVGVNASSYNEFVQKVICHVKSLWERGADIVLLPEYLWLGAERLMDGEDKLRKLAAQFWQNTWPHLGQELYAQDKMAVLGTCPFVKNGKSYNRAPILMAGNQHFQDKLCMTPWEDQFEGGDAIHILHFKGLRIAVQICLDIEITELAYQLKGQNLDLILVPSATENILGVERINRCASSRSVELGCHVAVAHLVGKTDSVLVDGNQGCTSFYTPSQSAFRNLQREQRSEIYECGNHASIFELSSDLIQRMRKMKMETNPYGTRPTSTNIFVTNF